MSLRGWGLESGYFPEIRGRRGCARTRRGFHNGLTGMDFILPQPCFLWAQVLSFARQTASSCCRLCIPRVDFLSLILIFYHFVSFVSRLLSGRADFGLWPLSGLRVCGGAEYNSGRRAGAQVSEGKCQCTPHVPSSRKPRSGCPGARKPSRTRKSGSAVFAFSETGMTTNYFCARDGRRRFMLHKSNLLHGRVMQITARSKKTFDS